MARTMVLPDPINPSNKTSNKSQGGLLFAPVNRTLTFSVRYVRADASAGPEKKHFDITLVPLKWSSPDDVDSSIRRVGYGTSLALDKKTDRMHISYLRQAGFYD